MLFNSQIFLLGFLPLLMVSEWLTSGRDRLRLLMLTALSLAFYAYWDPALLPLLAGSIAINWLIARMYMAVGHGAVIMLGVALNLGLLGLFKYAGFLAENWNAATGSGLTVLDLALPLGVSFFTFQQISYLVDLRRRGAPLYSLGDFALYIAFFPQLIAGPIVRHNEFMANLALRANPADKAEMRARGAVLTVIGLAKKVLIADPIGVTVTQLFSRPAESLSFAEAWVAAFGFTAQIYFDFSAYSDIAIGLALAMGIRLPINFDAPYRAASLIDFWRRWHMTLARFLRDYLYIPLGGNRSGLSRQALAILVTMFFSGLWHGAGWTFILWGCLHGLGVTVNRIWRRYGLTMPAFPGWLITFVFVVVCFVLFRAQSLEQAGSILGAMAGLNGLSLSMDLALAAWRPSPFGSQEAEALAWVTGGLAIALLGIRSHDIALKRLSPVPWVGLVAGLVAAYCAIDVGATTGAEFIYFQF